MVRGENEEGMMVVRVLRSFRAKEFTSVNFWRLI